MLTTRLRSPATLALAAAVIVAGCNAQGGNKAGGPAPAVVLRMATVNGEPGHDPAVDELIKRVASKSNGNVTIEVVYGVGESKPDAEQQLARGVADGAYDLGVVGTRVFDTLGVNSFQALTAPLLIDTYDVEASVIGSDIPAEMLRSLDGLEVTGLGVLAGGLQKPIGVKRPLVGPDDWRGVMFGVHRSRELSAAIEALGGETREVFAQERTAALDQGLIQGFELDLLNYRLLDLWHQAPYVTANVNLWPDMLAILGNPGRLAKLSNEQHDWLTSAVRETAAASTSLVSGDAAFIPDLCRQGARFTSAGESQVAALKSAFASVYTDLERDPQTQRFIAGIRELKSNTSTETVAIPNGCTGGAVGSTTDPSPQPSRTATKTALDGTWEVAFTEEELAAKNGVDPSEIVRDNSGTFTVSFDRGQILGPVKRGDRAPEGLTYVVEGDVLTIYAPDASMGGQVPPPGPAIWRYRWSVYGDSLIFEKLGGQEPGCALTESRGMCEPSVFVVKPWHRTN